MTQIPTLETPNRNYKDTVFRSFLGTPERLIEIYNAVEGTDYPPDTPVVINTLEQVLWMGKQNDISFILDGQMIVLLEHQSTMNPNMALRMLLYIAKLYENGLPDKTIYSSQKVQLPYPKFIVLYNGMDPQPAHQTFRLSDHFIQTGKKESMPPLELTVDIYNINLAEHSELIKRSVSLTEYSTLVYYIQEGIRQGAKLTNALNDAVERCKKEGVMAEFLQTHGGSIMGYLIHEFDIDMARQVWEEEARISLLISLVHDQTLTIEEAAAKAGLEVDEMQALLIKKDESGEAKME